MQRRLFLLALPAAATGCGATSVWAPDADLARVRYREPGPSVLSLFTVRNNGDNQGAHTGLVINASERVIFDPAGSFAHASIPERNDVLYGITPRVLEFYTSYHASYDYHVVRQTVEVSPEIAERALRLAESEGPVPKAFCTRATSTVLQQLPGYAFLPNTFLPENLMEAFQSVPGVQTDLIYQDDDDNLRAAQEAYDALLRGETRLNRQGG